MTNPFAVQGLMRENILAEMRSYPPRDERRRMCAANHRLRTYPDECPKHGDAPHKTSNGDCTECTEAPRKIARRAGRSEYVDYCEKHGQSSFSVLSGKCLECFTKNGLERKPPSGQQTSRARARAVGEKIYLDHCATCGTDTDHSVLRGKCLVCFNTLGQPRPPAGPFNQRAAARRAGALSFLATCPTHGAVEHSVAHGKCLGCFTVAGAVRQANQGTSPQAISRRVGARTYRDQCRSCGSETEHGTQRGKCLTCFDTLGVPRTVDRVDRPEADDPHTLAKRDGHATYLTRCTQHGVTLHDTETGECLTCWALDAAMTAP